MCDFNMDQPISLFFQPIPKTKQNTKVKKQSTLPFKKKQLVVKGDTSSSDETTLADCFTKAPDKKAPNKNVVPVQTTAFVATNATKTCKFCGKTFQSLTNHERRCGRIVPVQNTTGRYAQLSNGGISGKPTANGNDFRNEVKGKATTKVAARRRPHRTIPEESRILAEQVQKLATTKNRNQMRAYLKATPDNKKSPKVCNKIFVGLGLTGEDATDRFIQQLDKRNNTMYTKRAHPRKAEMIDAMLELLYSKKEEEVLKVDLNWSLDANKTDSSMGQRRVRRSNYRLVNGSESPFQKIESCVQCIRCDQVIKPNCSYVCFESPHMSIISISVSSYYHETCFNKYPPNDMVIDLIHAEMQHITLSRSLLSASSSSSAASSLSTSSSSTSSSSTSSSSSSTSLPSTSSSSTSSSTSSSSLSSIELFGGYLSP